MRLDISAASDKDELLPYFKNRASEIVSDLQGLYGKKQVKKITQNIPKAIRRSRDSLIHTMIQTAEREGWSQSSILSSVLMISHTANAAMLEAERIIERLLTVELNGPTPKPHSTNKRPIKILSVR